MSRRKLPPARLTAEEEREVFATADKVHRMLVHAIGTGSKFTVKYDFKHRPTLTDLAGIEKNLNYWIVDTLRHMGAAIPRRRLFHFTMLDWKDDGDNTVTIHLDFAVLLPFERTPAILAACERLLSKDDEPQPEEPAR